MIDTKNYIDKKKFYDAMCDFLQKRKEDPNYKIPEYIGECIYQICNRIMYSPNFINYPYRDLMIGQAIENCIRYVDRFDPVNYDNPFAYYSQIAYWAGVYVINKEKLKIEGKARYVQSGSLYLDMIDTMEVDDDGADYFDPESISALGYLYNYVIPEKKKLPENIKKKSTTHSLDEFIT